VRADIAEQLWMTNARVHVRRVVVAPGRRLEAHRHAGDHAARQRSNFGDP